MKTRFGFVLGLTLTTAHFALPSAADAQPTACTGRSSGAGARIEEASFVPLGGIEQWVTIRGDDRLNPVLLHVHGGPGEPIQYDVRLFGDREGLAWALERLYEDHPACGDECHGLFYFLPDEPLRLRLEIELDDEDEQEAEL